MRYAIVLCLLALAACDDAAAMTQCEKTHSHDECFYALNR
jgi:hypothetical protein